MIFFSQIPDKQNFLIKNILPKNLQYVYNDQLIR